MISQINNIIGDNHTKSKKNYMKLLIKTGDINKLDVDALIVFAWENDLSVFPKFNTAMATYLKEAGTHEEFEGKEGQFLTTSSKGMISAYKLIITGLGKKDNFDIYEIYKNIALSLRKAKEFKPVKVALIPSEYWLEKYPVRKIYKIMVEASYLANYRFSKYKSEASLMKLRTVEELIMYTHPGRITGAELGMKEGLVVSEAVCFSRDLINEPACVTTPEYLSKVALSESKNSKNNTKVNIIEFDEIKKLGMGAFLGVARGSEEPPKFIRLQYKPKNSKKKIVLIGKGITFDTGGLSLKPVEYMETMKLDMAGAACVLAIFNALNQLSVSVEVVGLIAACENMPSGRALKPGDILTAMNGKTIEVLNTDAEGRLTIADAISFAVQKEKPDEIIDIATLTGACRVALGEEIAGIWGNDTKMVDLLVESGKNSGEKVWKMPLEKEYKELIKSSIADVRNIQIGRFGGAISAALFLAEFVSDISWAHLDIAGPAYAEKDTSLSEKGGVGFGVRLLLQYLTTK